SLPPSLPPSFPPSLSPSACRPLAGPHGSPRQVVHRVEQAAGGSRLSGFKLVLARYCSSPHFFPSPLPGPRWAEEGKTRPAGRGEAAAGRLVRRRAGEERSLNRTGNDVVGSRRRGGWGEHKTYG
ncbi:hypothetical protein Naga_102032g1, partial [Nannochloropsis gaditana]